MVSLTQTAAVELRSHNIRVNAILPGFVGTELVASHKHESEQQLGIPDFDAVVAQRQGRYGTPEARKTARFATSSGRSSFCNGGAYVLDGGVSSSLL